MNRQSDDLAVAPSEPEVTAAAPDEPDVTAIPEAEPSPDLAMADDDPTAADNDPIAGLDLTGAGDHESGGAFVPKAAPIALTTWTAPKGYSFGYPPQLGPVTHKGDETMVTGHYDGAVVSIIIKGTPFTGTSLPPGREVMVETGATHITTRSVRAGGQRLVATAGDKSANGYPFRCELVMIAGSGTFLAVTITVTRADFARTEAMRNAVFASVTLPEQ